MIEDEILAEIKQEQADRLEEPYLFPKEEMNSLIKWRPVSNIPVEEIYKDLPRVKEWHENYIKVWKIKEHRR